MKILDLHVLNDRVFYNEQSSPTNPDYARSSVDAHPSGLSVSDFLESSRCRSADCVRALGLRQNAGLLLGLYAKKQAGQIQSVQVATPLACRTRCERKSPDWAIQRMEQIYLAASQGGFHEFVDNDYQAYALAVEVRASEVITRNTLTVSEKALGLLKGHPAWRGLSFIQSLNPTYVAGLLAHLLDPRWYIDLCSPDRMSYLHGYLGLTPLTQRAVTLASYEPWRHHRACNTVLRCWKDVTKEREVRQAFELTGPVVVRGSYQLGRAPWDFPWRVWGYHLGFGMPEKLLGRDPVIADLRASQKLVDFLQYTWLNTLYLDSTALPDGRLSLFRAVDFFKWPAEVEEYEKHYVQTAG
jgi:hypothetical protein